MIRHDFRCDECGTVEERFVPASETACQTHTVNGQVHRLAVTWERGMAPGCRVGMVERSREIRNRGLIEIGSEKLDTTTSWFDGKAGEAEEKRDREVFKSVESIVDDLGDSLYSPP